jgi:hypothetical protein
VITPKGATVAGHYEATCRIQVLRACQFCGSKHPLACNPPVESDLCLNCGMPVPVAEPPIEVPSQSVSQVVLQRVLALGKRLHLVKGQSGC